MAATWQAPLLERRQQQASSAAPQTLIANKKFVSSTSYQYLPIEEVWPSSHKHHLGSYYNPVYYPLKHLPCSEEKYCTRNKHKSVDGGTRLTTGNGSSILIAVVGPKWNQSNDGKRHVRSKNFNMNIKQKQNDCIGQDFIPANKRAEFNLGKNLSLVLFILTLLCIQNALPCSSFSSFVHDHDTSLVDSNYAPTSFTPRPYLTPQYNGARSVWNRQLRSNPIPYDNDGFSTGLMSDPIGSFSQNDPASTNPQVAQSWTSILTNPFGIGSSNSNTNSGGNDILDKHIKAILVPRVSGTAGNVQVRQYIVDVLKRNDYHVELDEFTGFTPVGDVQFANIIASSNPRACRQLVLACHYDSKMMDGFLGATDSAVPCAMLLKISETSNKTFRPASQTDEDAKNEELGLRFIFFDGEEAFDQWTSTDSLYGSRHLAAKWEKQAAPVQCKSSSVKTELDRIELFVLLDLIGTSDTTFVMYNSRLKHHYDALQSYERAHLLKTGMDRGQVRRQMAFKSRNVPLDFMEDDHVPFKKRGVPILLLLAHPFPNVWHKVSDNYQSIDFSRTRRILHVMEQFVDNYSKKKD